MGGRSEGDYVLVSLESKKAEGNVGRACDVRRRDLQRSNRQVDARLRSFLEQRKHNVNGEARVSSLSMLRGSRAAPSLAPLSLM